ncbi:Zinc finger protein 808 [Frankliniella fusca]|uniref:Zinc finger protein 808 n=1 Tax=Frankliniella fusca TaxID=407009 RepID=A0AAE1LRG5_9NEOP|nr:Zinc finger protein 808 [Frankliniella fusca]
MASPEEQVIANLDGNKVPLFLRKSQERLDTSHQTDNEFNGFSSEDIEISSSKALCSKFYVNHRERVSKEIEQRIFLRSGLSCVKCQLTFSSLTHIAKHNEFCGKFSVFVPGSLDYLTQNVEKLRENASDMLICPWCPVLCAHSVALRKHISKCKEANKKKNEKKVLPLLSCPECPVVYLSLLDLLYHLHCHYIGDIQCSRCSRLFSTTSSLVSHLNKCDMKKVFVCGDCQSLFRDSLALQHHLKSCESKTQCLKCAKVIGSRRLSMDHIIFHLSEEWAKSGFEMDDGTLYRLPRNHIKEPKADVLPKRKYRRRKRLKSNYWTHRKTLASKSSKIIRSKQKMQFSKNLRNASNSFVTNPLSHNSKEPPVLTKKRKLSKKDSKFHNGNTSEIIDSCIGLNGAEADSANENISCFGNEMYEIENDIGESECVVETESFPTELLPHSHVEDMDDKDPLDFETNSLFTPSLENNDGLSLTVVNVEGGAHLFNWDDENDSESVPVCNPEPNLDGKYFNISEVSRNCIASDKETFDEADENEDQDSGIEATEDGDSNKDKTDDPDNLLEPPTNKNISAGEVPSNAILPLQIEYKSTPEIVPVEEIGNSEVFVATEVTVPSEGGDSKPKKYSVVDEHSYCLPKGQVLPWFKIRTLHNKRLREEKKREMNLLKDGKLETSDPANLNVPKKFESQDTRKRIAKSSKIKVKGVQSMLTRKQMSKSGLKVSVKKALLSSQGTRVKKISHERTVFGEVCENLLLMAPESSSAIEHSNPSSVSENTKLSDVEKTGKSAFGEACESLLLMAPESSSAIEHPNPPLVSENTKLSDVEKTEKSAFAEACENLLLMPPESSSALEHPNPPLVSEHAKLSDVEKNKKGAFGEACENLLFTGPENLPVKEQSNSTFDHESCASSSVVKNIDNDSKEVFRETTEDSNVSPLEPGKDVSDKKTFSTGSVSSSIRITAETPVDICNIPTCKDLMRQNLEPVLDSNNVSNNIIVGEVNGLHSQKDNLKINSSPSLPEDLITLRQITGKDNSNGKVVNLPSLVPVIQNNTVIGYFMASFPPKKVKLNVASLKLFEKSIDQNSTDRVSEAKETCSRNTTSVDLNPGKQNCSDKILLPLHKAERLTDSVSQHCPTPIGAEVHSTKFYQAEKQIEELSSMLPPTEEGENLLHSAETSSAQEKSIFTTFLEKANEKRTLSEADERLRNYRRERSMLARGFKQIATSFPWKNSVTSETNPLEKKISSDADVSKSLLAKTTDDMTLNLLPSLSTATVTSDDGVFKTSLKKLSSELNVLYSKELEVLRLIPLNHKVKSTVKDMERILLKHKKILKNIPQSKLGDDFFKFQLKDFLADLLSILSCPDRDIFQEEEDVLTAGLRQLVSKCSDALINLNPEAPDSGPKCVPPTRSHPSPKCVPPTKSHPSPKCLPPTKSHFGPKCFPPTKSLMFIVDSDGSLQPHPNFQSSSLNESKHNLPFAAQPSGLPPHTASLTFDALTNEITGKENANICVPPIEGSIESGSDFHKTVEIETSVLSACFTKTEEVDSSKNRVEATQSENAAENVESCDIVISFTEDKKEEESTKSLVSVDFQQDQQCVKSLEFCAVKTPSSHENSKKSESKMILNEFDSFQAQHSVVDCGVTVSSDKGLKAEISQNTSSRADTDVLEVLQSVPNIEHYDVVLMSSSDEDTEYDFNFESCSSPATNLEEEVLEKHTFSVSGTSTGKDPAAHAVETINSQFETNVSVRAATSQNDGGATLSYTELTIPPVVANDSNDKTSLRESAFSKLKSTLKDGLDNREEESSEKIMHSSLQKVMDNSRKPNEGTEESCGLVLNTNCSLSSKQEELPERFKHSSVEEDKSSKHNKDTDEPYSFIVNTSTKQKRISVANDCMEVDKSPTDVTSRLVKVHLMGPNKLNSANILPKCAGNSTLKIKITEASVPTRCKVVSTPLKILRNVAALGKLEQKNMLKTRPENLKPTSSGNNALQLKLMETNPSQKKSINLNNSQSKMVKSSLGKGKDAVKHPTTAGGRRKWLSHFRVSSFLYRKTLPGLRNFRKRGMGREGLRRVTKTSYFTCKQCPLWFYTQRDLERLHVCSRLILEKKFNSDKFDRFFEGKLNKNALEESTKLKEPEDQNLNCVLQDTKLNEPEDQNLNCVLQDTKLNEPEDQNLNCVLQDTKLNDPEDQNLNSVLQDTKPEEQKTNADLPKCNLSQESLVLKESTDNNGLSPFETYVKMKKMRNFSCEKCPLVFKSFSTLHEHKSNFHTDGSMLECHICGKQFSRLQKLAVHCAKSHKISTKSENCKKSSQNASSDPSSESLQPKKKVPMNTSKTKTAETNQLKISPFKAKVKSYQCKICNRAFLGSGGLQSHINQSHSTLHKCSLCPRRFTYFERLKQHYLDLHPGSEPNLLQKAVSSVTESQTDTTQEGKENNQEAEGANLMALVDTCADPSLEMNVDSDVEAQAGQNRSKKRKKSKWRIVNDVTNEEIGPKKGIKAPKLSDERPLVISFSKIKKSHHKCNLCSESFKKHQSLVHHLSNYHQNGPFSCTVCHTEEKDALQFQLHFNKCTKKKVKGKSAVNHVTSPLGSDIPVTCSKADEKILNHCQEGANQTSNIPHNNKTDLSEDRCAETSGKTAFHEHGLSKQQVAEELEEHNRENDQSQSVAQVQVGGLDLVVENNNQQISAPECDLAMSDVKSEWKSNQAASSSNKEENSLIRKQPWVRKGGWKCQVCQKDFGTKGFLERHCIKSHGAPAKYNCPYCGKIFIGYRSLRIHHKTKHSKKKWLSVDKSQTDDLPLSSDHSKSVCSSETLEDHTVLKKCSICGKGFRRNIDLRRHKNRHRTAVTCPLCKLQFETKKALAYHHSQLHVQETFHRETLSSQPTTKFSDSSSSLGPSNSSDNHLERPSLYPSSSSQEVGEAAPHSEEVEHKSAPGKNSVVGIIEEFQCADCSLSYKKYSCLKRHRILMHSEPASHYCNICGKGFSYSHSLKNHVMTHSRGELNSKRSNRYGTRKSRSAYEGNLEVLDSSLERNAHQDSQHPMKEESFPSTGSAENHASFNASKEPCAEDTPISISEENGVDCLSPNDCIAKSNGQESLVPENKKKTDSTIVPHNSEFEEKKSCPNSGVISPHTMSVSDKNVPPAFLPWNGVIQNSFPPSNYLPSSHSISSYPTSSFTTNDNQWTSNLQNSEALNICYICGLCLPSWQGLQEHYCISHPNPNVFALPASFPSFPQDYPMYNSFGAYHEGPFPIHPAVPTDNGSSSSFHELTSHSVAHCSFCGLCFPNILALQEHYASHMASLSACSPAFQSTGLY